MDELNELLMYVNAEERADIGEADDTEENEGELYLGEVD